MRLAIFVLLALLSAAAVVKSQPQLFVIELRVWKGGGEEVRYVLLEWNGRSSLMLPVDVGVEGLVVRVDSSTPFKPYAVVLDEVDVVACYEEGIVVIEDFVWINFTKLGWRPRTVIVRFDRSDPKPPIYALYERGGSIWGYLIEALCSDVKALGNLTSFKVTILSKRPLKVQASMGDVLLWDLVLLQTGGELDPILEILRRVSLELRVKTLYYSTVLNQQPLYLYVNAPAACRVQVDASINLSDTLSRVFPGNPALYAPQAAANVGSCTTTVVNPGPLDYSVAGVYVPARSTREITLTLTGSISAEAFKSGVRVYALTVHGIPRLLELPSYIYGVEVHVVNNWGKPVGNVTVLILGVNSSLREVCQLANGACFIQEVPAGVYTVAAYVGAREVGRALVTVERGVSIVVLKVDLNDFEMCVLYPTGERVAGYTVVLRAQGLKFEAEESGGRALFRDVPSGFYSYEVVKGGVVLASGSLKVEARRQGYVVIANVSRVHLKVVDFLGRPLPRVDVQVRGAVSASGRTDERGELTLDLPFGEYEIRVEEIGVSQHVNVRNGGEYFILSSGIPMLYPALVAVAVVIVAALKGVRRRGEVEVLDLDES